MAQSVIKLKFSKSRLLIDVVEYLGHVIDAEWLHPSLSKVEAVLKAPAPRNITERQFFFFYLVNYYRKYI